MACMGCGRISETRLCCPTCIEYGRTSFFCDQECFTKNWNAHNQLHEMLRRKKAMGSGGGNSCPPAGPQEAVEVSPGPPADGSGGDGGAGRGSSVSGTSGGSFGGSSSSTSGGLAPLAGGTSIVDLTVQKRNTGGGKTAGAGAGVGPAGAGGVSAAGAGPGVFGSIMGQARTMFGEAGAAAAFKNRLGGQRARPRSPSPPTRTKAPPRGRERSVSGDRGRLASGQPVAPRRSFNVQLSLWGLVLVCTTAGMLFYREHERYIDNPSPNTMSSVAAVVPPPRPTKKSASVDVVAAPAAAVAVAAAAPAADAAASGLAAVAPQSEIQALRAMVDRHEQMLRYIMDRYAEKTSDGKLAEGVPGTDVHEAVQVDMTKPEFESKSFGETAAEKAAPRGNPSLRKRHVGDDAVGIPTLER